MSLLPVWRQLQPVGDGWYGCVGVHRLEMSNGPRLRVVFVLADEEHNTVIRKTLTKVFVIMMVVVGVVGGPALAANAATKQVPAKPVATYMPKVVAQSISKPGKKMSTAHRNQVVAWKVLSTKKWKRFATKSQFTCLRSLWTRESGWSHRSMNSSSGAYGIPQSLPGSKMASAGKDWRTNPETQVKWGLGYIKGRYGSPCGAWGAFQSKGWY